MARFTAILLIGIVLVIVSLLAMTRMRGSAMTVVNNATVWTYNPTAKNYVVEGFFSLKNQSNKTLDNLSILTNCDCLKYEGLVDSLAPHGSSFFKLTTKRDAMSDDVLAFDFTTSDSRVPLKWKLSKSTDIIIVPGN